MVPIEYLDRAVILAHIKGQKTAAVTLQQNQTKEGSRVKNKVIALITGLMLASGVAQATEVELRPDHPETYVVQVGDTLWDISETFLKTPWLWPKLWQANPQIDNPHLIYPGDKLRLVWVTDPATGETSPMLVRDEGRIVKLGPKVRLSEARTAIPTISLKSLQPFLQYEQLLTQKDMETRPYIVGTNDKTSRSAANQTLYAKSADRSVPPHSDLYGIYRRGGEVIDPKSGDSLGFRAKLVAVAEGRPSGEFTRLDLVESKSETRNGDLVMPIMDSEDLPIYFQPSNPSNRVEGVMLHTANDVAYAGKMDVVAINLGSRDNIKAGHVLALLRPGAEVYDNPPETPTYREESSALEKMFVDFEGKKSVRLPNERIGEVMVFKAYERISYAFVMRAEKPAAAGDIVTNP